MQINTVHLYSLVTTCIANKTTPAELTIGDPSELAGLSMESTKSGHYYSLHALGYLQVGGEVSVNSNGFISSGDMVDHFMQARSSYYFAAILLAELINEQTRMQCNVHGRG